MQVLELRSSAGAAGLWTTELSLPSLPCSLVGYRNHTYWYTAVLTLHGSYSLNIFQMDEWMLVHPGFLLPPSLATTHYERGYVLILERLQASVTVSL